MKARLKQPLALLLALAMALGMMCGSAGATTVASGFISTVASGNCGRNGDNVTWSLDSTGTLTISGTGEMEAGPDEEHQHD